MNETGKKYCQLKIKGYYKKVLNYYQEKNKIKVYLNLKKINKIKIE